MPTKAPVIAARFLDAETYAGGCFAVANHVAGFCREVHLVTCLGADDPREDFAREHLLPNVTARVLHAAGAAHHDQAALPPALSLPEALRGLVLRRPPHRRRRRAAGARAPPERHQRLRPRARRRLRARAHHPHRAGDALRAVALPRGEHPAQLHQLRLPPHHPLPPRGLRLHRRGGEPHGVPRPPRAPRRHRAAALGGAALRAHHRDPRAPRVAHAGRRGRDRGGARALATGGRHRGRGRRVPLRGGALRATGVSPPSSRAFWATPWAPWRCASWATRGR